VNNYAFMALCVLLAYLIGAIPFGYLTARWLRGIDIRTMGSGNIGATNVGRIMGFRFFLLVFTFDLCKGLLPTLYLSRLIERLGGTPPPETAVLVALATILGHNYPVYLGFKGGKGAATSLGAVSALDLVAGLSAAAGFVAFVLLTRYVSLSALTAGLVFVIVHFARASEPFSRKEIAMSVLTVSLLVLLVARHTKNIRRLRQGTEPKVSFRKKRDGRVRLGWLIALAVAAIGCGAGLIAVKRSSKPEVLQVGGITVLEVSRAATGHQRAERLAFLDAGRVLAVTCPRYDRLVFYRVNDEDELELARDVELDGKPVALCSAKNRLYVLMRPAGDRRHVEPGWWTNFDASGETTGEKVLVGFYPDDLAVSRDGKYAYVLTSGRAEGGSHRAAPALEVFELGQGSRPVGRLEFDGPKDDPARLTLSATGRQGVVTLLGSNAVASIDLTDAAQPKRLARAALPDVETPYPSRGTDDWIVMPVLAASEGLAISARELGDCVAGVLPQSSAIALLRTSREATVRLGRLTLRSGAFGFSKTRPIGLAFSPERNLIAVANRSGSVHLVAIRAEGDRLASRTHARSEAQ
jgi:acyl-phosphate glycerol 3-phosphate acyltransferase